MSMERYVTPSLSTGKKRVEREREGMGKGKGKKMGNFFRGSAREARREEWGHASWKFHVASCHWLCAFPFSPGDPTCCHVTVNPVLWPRRIRILSLYNSLSLSLFYLSPALPALSLSLLVSLIHLPLCPNLSIPLLCTPLVHLNLMVFWSLGKKVGMPPSLYLFLCVFHSSIWWGFGGFSFLWAIWADSLSALLLVVMQMVLNCCGLVCY